MDSQDKIEFVNKLIQLAEKIIFRESPFEEFVLPTEFSNSFIERYHRHKREISDQQKEQLKEFVKKWLQEIFYRRIGVVLRREPFKRAYPDLFLVKEQFDDWCKAKEGEEYNPFITGWSGPNPCFDIDKIITETIRSRSKEYKIAKKKPFVGGCSFYKNIDADNKFYVGFERGSLRTFMSIMVGFENPWIGFDIGYLFLITQSRFDYVLETESIGLIDGQKRLIIECHEPVPENVVDVTNRAIDLAETLLPHILECFPG